MLRHTLDTFGCEVTTEYTASPVSNQDVAVQNLHAAGVCRVFIDGSFVTTKADPNDIDGCWEWTEEVHLDLLDPVLLDFTQARGAMREKYGVDFFLATWVEAGSGLTFLDFFQRNREDDPKGIVQLDLEELS